MNKVSNKIRMHVFYVFMLIFMIGLAVTTTFIGNLTPDIIEHYGLNYSQAGNINFLFQIGGFASLLLGAFFSDRTKKSNIIIASAIVMSAGLCLIGIVPPYIFLLVILFALGMSTQILNILTSGYTCDIVEEKKQGGYVTFLLAFYSIGSTVASQLSSRLANYVWTSRFLIIGLGSGVFAILFLVSKFVLSEPDNVSVHTDSTEPAENTYSLAALGNMLKNHKYILVLIMAFLYTGHQTTIMMWLPTYLTKDLQMSEMFMGSIISLYWTGVLGGRILYTAIFKRFNEAKFIMVSSILGSILFALAIFSGQEIMWQVGVAGLGILTGALFPLFIMIGCSLFPKNSGSASSFVGVAFALGSALFPYMLGFIADFVEMRISIYIAAIALFVIGILIPIGHFEREK
ncbi:MFS transporter [Clostridiaceae bacterium Marseille-Q4145]|nr:MFS transporter [Clostridiaceae bacterium Marseille-Q4145]